MDVWDDQVHVLPALAVFPFSLNTGTFTAEEKTEKKEVG